MAWRLLNIKSTIKKRGGDGHKKSNQQDDQKIGEETVGHR